MKVVFKIFKYLGLFFRYFFVFLWKIIWATVYLIVSLVDIFYCTDEEVYKARKRQRLEYLYALHNYDPLYHPDSPFNPEKS